MEVSKAELEKRIIKYVFFDLVSPVYSLVGQEPKFKKQKRGAFWSPCLGWKMSQRAHLRLWMR